MPSIGTLFRVELTKLLRRPMTWVLSLILFSSMAFVYLSMILALSMPESANVDQASLRDQILMPKGLYFSSSIAASLSMIMIIILAAGSVGGEFNWSTIRTNLLMGAPRSRLLAAKLIALEILGAVWYVIALALGIVGAVVAAVATHNPAGSNYLSSGEFARDVGLTVFHVIIVVAVWTLIAAATTVITGSLAAGMGITLAQVLLGSEVAVLIAHIGTVGKWVSRIIPNRALDALTALDSASPPSYVATDWIWITVSIVGWSVLFSFLAWRRFKHMNLVGTS